ncbi:MAG: hypothetical protein ABUL72_03970, partial [Armatimonadota bacterium]
MAAKSSVRTGEVVRKSVIIAVLCILSVVFAMPLVWMISTSLKSNPQTMEDPVDAPFFQRMSVLWIPQPQDTAK